MSFSHWLNSLRNRLQTPPNKLRNRRRRKPLTGGQAQEVRSPERLEDRTLLTITFNDPVILTADVTITETSAAGSVTFNNTVDSDGTPRDLTINTPAGASTVLAGLVGNSSQLATLTTDSPGPTTVSTSSITAEAISLNDSVSITTGSVLTADEIDFGGGTDSVSGSVALSLAPLTSSANIVIGGSADSGASVLDITDGDLAALTDGFTSLTIGDTSGTGTITLDSATFDDPVTIAGGTIKDGSGTDITAPSVTLDGTVAPGQSPGILVINGNFAFADNSTYQVEIGGTTAGNMATNHDQIDVTGTVTIGANVTLTPQSFSGFVPSGNDEFVIIDNDSSDAVTGTFSGLAEGATLSNFLSSGLDATISYAGGDGNDVVITVESGIDSSATLMSGTLTIADTSSSSDDSLTISFAAGTFTITDNGGLLLETSIAGATGSGTSTLTVPETGITSITIDGQGGDDSLEVDLSGGAFPVSINYAGGGQTSGDDLTFTTTTVTSVTHVFTNANDGSVSVVSGGSTSTINYTGLEPIFDNLNATDRVFQFTGGSEIITLSDDADAGDGESFIDSNLGESVTFQNPTGSLTIELDENGGSGNDQVLLTGLDSTFDADLNITGGDDDDNVHTRTNATSVGTGDIDIDVAIVVVESGAGLATNGGNITLAARRNILIDDSVTSGGGNITLNADSDANSNGDFLIQDATITSSGGNIVIGGGADPLTTPAFGNIDSGFSDGVYLHRTTISSEAGNISIRGTGPLNEDGIDIGDGSQLSATTGNITLVGIATGSDDGIDMHGGSSISTTTGDISLTGTAMGGSAEEGLLTRGSSLNPTMITTSTGAITLTGQGDTTHSGVLFSGFVMIQSTGTSGAGTITINGTADTTDFDEAGTFIDESSITSVSGDIDIDGVNPSGAAVVIEEMSLIQSSGTGMNAATISIDGDASGAGDFGVVIADLSSVTSVDGNIDITGTDTQSTGILLFGGNVSSTGTGSDAATITLMGTSTGIDGLALADGDMNGMPVASTVTSVAGDIQITGIGTGATDNGVTIEDSSFVSSTGTGATAAGITIIGTSGSERGVSVEGIINTVDGDVSITGDAGSGTEGVFVDLQINATGTGSVSITGTGNSGAATPTGVFFDGDVATDSGMITVLSNVGRVAVDSDQSLSAESGNVFVTTTDTAATGDNIELAATSAINSTDGNITLDSGDDVVLPMTGALTASVGTITINVDSGDADSGTGGSADLLGIVSSDSLVGTGGPDNDLIRLPSGMFGFNGVATLTGNDGNDTLTGGNGADSINGGAGSDSLDGGAGADTLTSGGGDDMISGGAGADLFQWNMGDGNDSFDGGADADSIETGTGTVTSVTHTFVNNSDGSFGVDAETVTYTNIEPIADNLDATNRVFTFTGGAETIVLTDDSDVGDGQSMIDSDLGEVVTFNDPSSSLTINAGSGSDTVNLTGLDSTFDADLTVNGDGTAMAGSASVNVNGDLNIASGTIAIGTSGDVTQVSFNGGSLTTTADVSLQMTDGIVDGDTTVDVTAAGLLLSAGESIGGGTADPLETTVANLEVAAARGLTIAETDDLTIGGVDAGTNGISTLSTITLSAGGTISVDEDVTTDAGTGGNLAVTGAVNIAAAATVSALDDSITLTANNDGDDDISIDGAITANAELTLTASRDVLVTAAVSNETNNDLRIVSDSDADGLGGTQVATAGSLTSNGLLFIDGSALFAIGAGAGPFVALDIQDDGANDQISAARSIIIDGDDADMNDSNIQINGALATSGVAQIQIIANGSISFGANGDLSAASGSLSIQADENADGTGSLTMNDGTVFTAGNDMLLEAGGDITVGSVQAGDEVEVNSSTGAIVDGGETNVDFSGASLLLLSETGTGTSADPLETAVTTVAGTTDSGAFHLTNTGPLTVTTIQAEAGNDIVGVMIEDSAGSDPANDIVITASSPLTISSDVVNNSGGSVILTASDSAAAGDDLTVDAVTISAVSGMITLNAGDNLTMDAGAAVSTTGDVVINLDDGDADTGTGTTSIIAGTFTVGSLTINGEADNDSIDASAITVGATFNGFAGDDTLIGGSGNDSINGNAGNDVLQGNAGEELFVWNNGDGSDMIDGGAGTDELEVNGSTVTPAGDTITVSANGARFDLTRADGGAGLGPFSLDVGTVETLDLNTLDGDDDVTVNDLTGVADLATLQIDAGAGNDTVDASALPDLGLSILLEGGDDDDTLTGAAGSSMINGNMGNDSLIGGAAADTIMGGGGDDVMDGGAGGDMLSGQAGDDTMTGGLGDDTMNGGAETDRIVESRDADFDLGDATLTISPAETDTLVDVEEADLTGGAAANTIDASDFSGVATLMGGDNDDTITGAMGASVVNGNMGNDSLTGLDADDTLMGGGNDDILNGGGGVDMLTGQAGNDTLIGGTGNDVVNGGDNDDLLIWNNGDGSDQMDGGADTDELEVSGSTVTPNGDDIIVSANGARFDLTRADGGAGLGPFSLDVGTIETLDLNTLDGDDNVTINDLTGVADLASFEVEGGDGNDTIDASALPNLGLNVLLEGGNDDDTITGSAGPSAINGNMGNDSLIGGAAADTIMGGGGGDIMNGGAGGDMLAGQAGDDTMTGGLGDDTFNGGAGTDRIVENDDTDFDLGDTSLVSPLTGTDVVADVEEADLTGGASANTIDASDFSGVATLMGGGGNDTITGAMGASVINGNGDDDSLTGLGSSDTIMGGGGNDIIDGGAGDDTLTGQANDDTIIGNTGDDNIMGGDGADLINGSLGNDTISGDAGDDRIQGSNQTDYPGNPLSPIPDLNTLGLTDRDSLLGGAGSDTIAGAIGADFIDGEADADIIDAQSGGDTTNGIDTIVGDMADFIFKDPEDTVL